MANPNDINDFSFANYGSALGRLGLVDDKHKSIEERLDKIESAIEIILDKLTR